MEAIAYGPLALRPAQFWDLTPREFVALAAGYRWREDRAWEKLAWSAARVLACFGWEGAPKDLLPKPVDVAAETAAFDAALGAGMNYDDVMAVQRAKGLSKDQDAVAP